MKEKGSRHINHWKYVNTIKEKLVLTCMESMELLDEEKISNSEIDAIMIDAIFDTQQTIRKQFKNKEKSKGSG